MYPLYKGKQESLCSSYRSILISEVLSTHGHARTHWMRFSQLKLVHSAKLVVVARRPCFPCGSALLNIICVKGVCLTASCSRIHPLSMPRYANSLWVVSMLQPSLLGVGPRACMKIALTSSLRLCATGCRTFAHGPATRPKAEAEGYLVLDMVSHDGSISPSGRGTWH